MTPGDVHAAAERLVEFHERFAPLFGKEQAQLHAYDSPKGLLTSLKRKSVEPISASGRRPSVPAMSPVYRRTGRVRGPFTLINIRRPAIPPPPEGDGPLAGSLWSGSIGQPRNGR
jgi:hypothetical protein